MNEANQINQTMHALPPSATPTALRVRHSQNRKAEGKFQHRGPSAPTRGAHRRPGRATSSRCKLPMTDFPVARIRTALALE